jgi:hypothetical protein
VIDPQDLFRSVVALSALFASMAWCLARPNWASMLSTVALAVLWPFVDRPLTGRILMVLSDTKGVTQSDLISVLAVLIATGQAIRLFLRSRRSRPVEAAVEAAPEAAPEVAPEVAAT